MTSFDVFDHLFDPVLVINQRREIQYFNHQSCIFFKMPPRLLKAKENLLQICDAIDFDLEKWINQGLMSFDVLTSPEIKLYLPHEPEAEYFVIMKLIPLSGSTGSFALELQDKTLENALHLKYREQLEELKKAHNQFLQADKLNMLGELTANISHEINNPLAIAAGHAEILKDFLSIPSATLNTDQLKKINDTVLESLERVNQIIKNMKDFLYQSEDQKEYCDLEEVMESAIEWITPAAQKAGVEIRKKLNAEKTSVLANRIKLEQVIINLVKNSLDAITERRVPNGMVVLSISKAPDDHQIHVDVIDNGPGISGTIKENLFKPFTSSKEAGIGTGLGLSICSKIMESHRGKLEHIETSSGCHFRMRMPMIELYSYTRNDKYLAGARKEKRILVLDNEVQILNVMNSFITQEGLVFVGSSHPEDALQFLNKANIDLIITDFSMPSINGGEFSRLAREAGYEGPILYMTSAKFIEQYNKDKKPLDIGGIIIKPFNRDEVMKTIYHALKEKEGAA